MMRRLACAALTIGMVAAAAPAWAQQSLGDVARKEAERRATAKKAVRTFSNADLDPSEITDLSNPPAPAVPSGEAGAAAAVETSANATPAAPAAAATPQQQEPTEAQWRANAEAIRGPLAKAQAELATLEVVASDTSKSPGERTASARMVALQRKTIEGLERRWLRLEEQAADARVPPAWLSPRPTLMIRIAQ